MKANRQAIRTPALGVVSILLITLAGCAAYQNDTVQTTRVDAVPLPQLGERVRLEGIRFKPDSAKLRSNSKPILDAAADLLKSEPYTKVYVDAYCDQQGTEKADRRLARQRAESVKSSLEARGIAPDRMITRGFASEHLVARTRPSQIVNGSSKVELISFTDAPDSTDLASSLSLSETSELD